MSTNILKKLEVSGFKSFAKTTSLEFPAAVSAIVGPNGSGKSNFAEAMRWVLGEQSIKSLRGKKGEDLIFNGSSTSPRLGKASVTLVFDNRNKILPIDYEEVLITRKIFRDGVNEYFINDSKVRLKDVIELLSNIGLGTSFHHIISQGEADRILSASPKERKQMLEDALGLKLYQMRKQEADRKLLKTRENIEQVEALRREIQPHLRFLRKQAEKAEKTVMVKEDLKKLYLEYFAGESSYLKQEEEKNKSEKSAPEEELQKIEKELSLAPQDTQAAGLKLQIVNYKLQIDEKESSLTQLRSQRNSLEREIGRFEGMIELEESKQVEAPEPTTSAAIASDKVKSLISRLNLKIDDGMEESDPVRLKNVLAEIKGYLHNFLAEITVASSSSEKRVVTQGNLEALKEKLKEAAQLLQGTQEKEQEINGEIHSLRQKIDEQNKIIIETEKGRIEMEGRLKELKSFFANLEYQAERVKAQKEDFEREQAEARALLGDAVHDYAGQHADFDIEKWRHGQREETRRQVERLKIKLEDSGGIGDDVLKEYNEVKSRDEFFEKELGDLENAVGSVKELIGELEQKIKEDFGVGLEKINKEFHEFLTSVFGGGKGELKVVKIAKRSISEGEENQLEEIGQAEPAEQGSEEGVEVAVSLPKKKVSSIDMLSGGERALTSIALLFAMTQVNPPPFLVLDETDAALDEANSKKYGDMIEALSKRTQLIIITHNRETMRRADVLYGVTMGSDSISRLLSIKFVEAEQYSK